MSRHISNLIQLSCCFAVLFFSATADAQQCTPASPVQQTSVGTNPLVAVAHGEGKYVAVGSAGTALWSVDGQQWFDLAAVGGPIGVALWDVDYELGEFIFVGQGARIFSVPAEDIVAGGTPLATQEAIVNLPSGITFWGVAASVSVTGSTWTAVASRSRLVPEGTRWDNYAFIRNCPAGSSCTWG